MQSSLNAGATAEPCESWMILHDVQITYAKLGADI